MSKQQSSQADNFIALPYLKFVAYMAELMSPNSNAK